MTPAAGGGERSLRFTTAVDSAFLDRSERALQSIVRERIAAVHRRRTDAMRRRFEAIPNSGLLRTMTSRAFAAAMSAMSLAGLVLAAGLDERQVFGMDRAQLVLFFSVALFFFWLPHRRALLWAYRPRSWMYSVPFLGPVSRMHARVMTKQARAAAPFQGEYDFTDERALYWRSTARGRTLGWSEKLVGWSRTEENLTVLFRTEKSSLPYCIILHEPSVELASYLAEIGIRPLGAAAES